MRPELLEFLVCPRTGQRLSLETMEAEGDDVSYGILSSEAAAYPVASGIPIFVPGHESVSPLLREGRLREATATAAFAGLSSRIHSLLSVLGGSERAGRLAGPPARWYRERELARATRVIFDNSTGRPTFDVVRHAYLASPARSEDAFNYFRYRFGMPRHLVSLSLVEAVPDRPGPVLDVGCGAGHITWALHQRLSPRMIVGVDASFFLLLAAQHQVAPRASFVCADACALPFPPGEFASVFSSDVLSYISHKSGAIREMRRVLDGRGTLALASLRNRLCRHVFGGEALAPAGWRALVADLPHRLVSDASVLEAYLRRSGAPAAVDVDDGDLTKAQTLCVLATKDPDGVFVDGAPFGDWPHARGPLAVNPLFKVVSSCAESVDYERQWPSATYLEDNQASEAYLPPRFSLGRAEIDDARGGGRPSALEPLLASLAVLALPPGYVDDTWPVA